MIHFMYGFDYDSSGSDQGRISPMLFNVNVYQIGDKYGVPRLKEQAKEKFAVAINACWQMADFPVAIASAYSTTTSADRGLRDLVVSTCLEHLNELLEMDGFKQVPSETSGVAADIVQSRGHQGSTITYRCPNCNAEWSLHSSGDVQFCPLCGDCANWHRKVKKW